MSMQITPLTPTLGAKISVVDIRRLDAAGFDKLRDIWQQYKIIFLRGQDINPKAWHPRRVMNCWQACIATACARIQLSFQVVPG
jgi:alpha-ketoglutarate-dependent taurine dioxygenase